MDNILDFIRAHVETRPQTPRIPGNHPSDLASDFACRRRSVIQEIAAQEGHPLPEPFTIEREGYFDEGHAIHAWFQNQVLAHSPRFQGTWECLRCDHVAHGSRPLRCPSCGKPADPYLRYVEEEIRIPDRDIVGHIDGRWREEDGEEIIVDLKSASSNGWSSIKEMKEGHRRQLNFYLEATGLDRGVILYVKKDCWYVMKEFYHVYDPELNVTTFDEAVLQKERHLREGTLPGRGDCTPGCWTQRKCWVARTCVGASHAEDIRTRVRTGMV